jgi:tryptophan synthase alpha chain
MNRIDELFKTKKNNILSVYFTAGYPECEDTVSIIESLSDSGADLIEIGIPFSDSVVDGAVIQNSNKIALENGMSIKKLFGQIQGIRTKVNIPLILMGYINPVLQFGVENFLRSCKDAGIDGVILPDLPLFEYENDYKGLFEAYGIYNILLVTPQTSDERIRMIDDATNGFIYVVSSASTTGGKKGINDEQVKYFERLKNMKLKNPLLIGFGISNHDTFSKACNYAEGAIVGSAFIKALSTQENINESIKNFISTIIN